MKQLVLFILLMITGSTLLFAGTYSGGDGLSQSTAYHIAATTDLIELSNTSGDWGAYFEQTADITFNTDDTQVDWDNSGSDGPAEGFSPIGNSTTKFTGEYDGDGYTIDNLFIDRSSNDKVGLFGYMWDATIEFQC